MAKLYVAGKFEDYLKVRALQEYAEGMGHTITFDWTQEAEAILTRSVPWSRSKEDQIQNAMNDKLGVQDCHALFALYNQKAYGTLIEIGMAIQQDKPVYLIGDWRYSVFWHLPNVTKLGPGDTKRALEALAVR